MELVLPNNYVTIDEQEMMYLDGEGWLALLCGGVGGVAGGIAGAITGAAAGAALRTINLPVIGTVSYAFILATCGAATGYMSGYITGYNFGRILESNLGWD
jgi:hypothetical protein